MLEKMNGNEFIAVIGQHYDNKRLGNIVAAYGIRKDPRQTFDEETGTAKLTNPSMGIELTFEDDRHLEAKSREFDERSMVFVNARMYGDGKEGFQPFTGVLPGGLSFDMGRKDVEAALGKKRVKDGKGDDLMRWDFQGYCIVVAFTGSVISSVAIQTPMEF